MDCFMLDNFFYFLADISFSLVLPLRNPIINHIGKGKPLLRPDFIIRIVMIALNPLGGQFQIFSRNDIDGEIQIIACVQYIFEISFVPTE
ncbi:hypothetical protein D3C77_380070 [compost metagenome]